MNIFLYFSTFLAYVFMILTAGFLLFIVVYVFHNVYTVVFDNVAPVPTLDVFEEIGMIRYKRKRRYPLTNAAMRIFVTWESCYLAYVNFATKTNNTTRNILVYFDRLTEIPIVGDCTSDLQLDIERLVSLHDVIDTVGLQAKMKRSLASSISSLTVGRPVSVTRFIGLTPLTVEFAATLEKPQLADDDDLD